MGQPRQAKREWAAKDRAREIDLTLPLVANWRRRLAAAKDPYRFLRVYFPTLFYQQFTKNRKEIVEAVMRAARYGGDQSIAAPRGEGKTTIVECLAVYCVFHGVLRFPLICAATGPDAERILANIKTQLETNVVLGADYPEVCYPIQQLAGAPQRANAQTVFGQRTRLKWSGSHVMLPRVPREAVERDCQMVAGGAVISTRGLDAAIRGVRYGELRPDLAIIDDPETRESVRSDRQTEGREQILEEDVAGLGGPSRHVARVMLTTVMRRGSLSYTFTDPQQKPSWHGKRYRLLEIPPKREDLWDEYQTLRQAGMADGDPMARKAHRFYLKNRKTMNAGALVSNPHRFSDERLPDKSKKEVSALQACYNVIADRGREHFDTEYQNDPPDENMAGEFRLTVARVQKQLSRYPRGVVPPDCPYLTGAIDVGKYACHWVVDAWRADATRYRIDYGVQEVWGTAAQSEDHAVDQAILRALHEWREATLGSLYQAADGEERPVNLVLIDAHYRPEAVYQFCREVGQRTFRPSMGFGQSGDGATRANFTMPPKGNKGKKLGDRWFLSDQPSAGVWLVCIDVDHWKRWTHDRYLTPTDRPGASMLFGEEGHKHLSMAKHLTAEEEVEEFVRGKGVKRMWKPISRNNHWFDADYLSAVAASMLGVRLLKPPGAEGGPRKRVKLSDLKKRK